MARKTWPECEWRTDRGEEHLHELQTLILVRPHWKEHNLIGFLNSRCRAIIAAAFSETPGLPHPWDRSHWNSIASAVQKAFSLYCQSERTVNDLPDESGHNWRMDISYSGIDQQHLRFAFGKVDNRSKSLPCFRFQFPLQNSRYQNSDAHGEVAFDVKSERSKDKIYNRFYEFLESELRFQLALDTRLDQFYPREDFGRLFPLGNEVYWDVRVRFSDFLRRFLEAFRNPRVVAPNPFTVFFLAPLTMSQNHAPSHTPSGLFGYRYHLDDGQRKFIAENKGVLINALGAEESAKLTNGEKGLLEIEKGIVPFPFGVCSEVYLRSCPVSPHNVRSIVEEYEYKNSMFAAAEKAILGDSTLMEIPLYATGSLPYVNYPDGPEIILCVALPRGHVSDQSFGNNVPPIGTRLKTYVPPVVDSSYAPFEPSIVIETSQRVMTKYLSSAPLNDDMGLIGLSEEMTVLRTKIRRFAVSNDVVLVTGETGTGKELVATALHRYSKRSGKQLVKVNCASFCGNPDLLHSELFGHVKGAFTDARQDRDGMVADASGGTLFLDQVEDMPLVIQAMLLRFLQFKEYNRKGESKVHTADIRIVAATNKNLEHMVRDNDFREDLYYRLCVLTIAVPPLRDREGDVAILARHFLHKEDDSCTILEDGAKVLQEASWPGNVRQLENFVKRLYNSEKETTQHFGQAEIARCL